MVDLLLIILLLLVGYGWSEGSKARERAFGFAKRHCQKMDVQLLDEYVALNGFWPRRDEAGKLKAWRSYQFEFTSTGNERYHGKLIMLGQKVTSIHLEPYVIEE
jgi:hypothetical protein